MKARGATSSRDVATFTVVEPLAQLRHTDGTTTATKDNEVL